MRNLFFIFLVFFMAMPVSEAFSCRCKMLKGEKAEKSDAELIKQAKYYGYFEVVDVQTSTVDRAIQNITVRPNLRVSEDPDELHITNDISSNCSHILKKGDQTKLLIFENNGNLHLKSGCIDLSKKAWDNYDSQIKNITGMPYIDYKTFHKIAANLDYDKHTISIDEFIEKTKLDNVVILDLRSKTEYDDGHIKNAKHVGADITKEILEKVAPSKDTIILTYCINSLLMTRSISLTDITLPQLYSLGYKNIYALESASSSINGSEYFSLEGQARLQEKLNFIHPKK